MPSTAQVSHNRSSTFILFSFFNRIIRILTIPICFAIFGLCATISYPTAIYLAPIPRFIESIATCALFQLYVIIVSSENRNERDVFFMNMPNQKKASSALLDNNGSLLYFRATCFKVFQFPVISFIITIVQIVTAAILCSTGRPAKAARIITTIILAISTLIAVLAIIHFYQHVKVELKPFGGLRKLVVLKVLIAVVILQSWATTIVISASAVHPTSMINLADFATGLPNFLTCCEMLIFAPFFLWAYRTGPYKQASRSSDYPKNRSPYDETHTPPFEIKRKFSPVLVLWQAINITDLLAEILHAFKARSSADSNNFERSSGEELRRTARYGKLNSSSDRSIEQELPLSNSNQ
ncbi:MAG: hypothetical protein MMC33_002853 [Icmadophila ericetorum]|nr:hypothetical protein [Icmadophila ericetorum]